ncbi:MAG: hypothetical protein ACPGFC_06435 [Paracoccaceae bacterium]
MVEQVTVLPVHERARLDNDQLLYLNTHLGTDVAEDVICRALEELVVRLSMIERAFGQRDRPTLRKHARALASVARQIGMVGLTSVAGDVTRCLDDGDDTALAAIIMRLIRVGEASLTAIWDFQEHAY